MRQPIPGGNLQEQHYPSSEAKENLQSGVAAISLLPLYRGRTERPEDANQTDHCGTRGNKFHLRDGEWKQVQEYKAEMGIAIQLEE